MSWATTKEACRLAIAAALNLPDYAGADGVTGGVHVVEWANKRGAVRYLTNNSAWVDLRLANVVGIGTDETRFEFIQGDTPELSRNVPTYSGIRHFSVQVMIGVESQEDDEEAVGTLAGRLRTRLRRAEILGILQNAEVALRKVGPTVPADYRDRDGRMVSAAWMEIQLSCAENDTEEEEDGGYIASMEAEGEFVLPGTEPPPAEGSVGSISVSTRRVSGTSSSDVVTSVVTIYIDGTAGSDANDGSAGSPVATMAGAAAVAPEVSTNAVIYRLVTAGNYAFTACPTVFGPSGYWALYGTAATRVTVRTGVAGAGTDALQIAATGLTVNQDQHFILEMTSGAASGYRRTVQQNTADSITPVRRFENQLATAAVTPAPGDTYTIYRPGAVITGLTSVTAKRMVWWDIAFDTLTASPTIQDCEIYASGVEFRGTNFPHFLHCRGSFGMWDNIDSGAIAVNTAFTHWSLPYSLTHSATAAGYFAAVGQSTDVATLALHRGCGVSCPSVVTTVTSATGGHMLFTHGALSILGTFGAVSHDQGTYLIGGYYWGNCRAHAQANVVVTGRAGPGVNPAGSSYFRRRIDLDRNSSMFCASPITSLTGGFAFVNILDGSTLTLAGTGNVMGNGSANDNLGTVDQNGTIHFNGTTTLAFNVSSPSYTSFGGSTHWNHSRVRFNAATTITNAGNRPYWVRHAIVEINAAVTYTGAGGMLVSDSGMIRVTGSLGVTNGPITVDGGHFTMGANVSVVTPPGDALIVKNGGNFVQAAGILSCAATAGDGLSCESGGRARLRSGANTVLTGAGAGNVGCRAKAGASVWFDGAPTSVTGPADLQVAGATYPNTDLSADHAFVSDGSGTTIGRAA